MNYRINHQPFTTLTLNLKRGESIKCQSGSMLWMSEGLDMETQTGGLGGMFKKAIMGESLALTRYIAREDSTITLSSQVPGDILLFDVSETPVIAQKSAFLAATDDVDVELYFQQKLSAGLFGGEGFIMQKFSGPGYVWAEIDGAAQEVELAENERIIVDTGCLAAMEETCGMKIQKIKGAKNVILGGEGLFNTVIQGPGKVWLQTMPASSLAMSLYKFMPHSGK